MVNYKAGDGAHYSINGDSTPVTVKKVSHSGKTVWVSVNNFRAKPGQDYFKQDGNLEGLFTESENAADPSTWVKFTLRDDDRFRQAKCRYISLHPGRKYRRDPSF